MAPRSSPQESVPRNEPDLRQWMSNFAAIVSKDPQAACLTPSEAANLAQLAGEFDAHMEACSLTDTRTAPDIARKNEVRDRAEKAFRAIAGKIRTDPNVSIEIKRALALSVDPRPKAPVPAPTTAPILSLVMADALSHHLRYADSLTPDARAKPRGVTQLQLHVAIHEHGKTITDPRLTQFMLVYTKTPFKVHFDQLQGAKGTVATYFGRWATATGRTGPWSIPVSMVLPLM